MSESSEDQTKDGFTYIEMDSESIHGYEVEVTGYPSGTSEDAMEVYAGDWSRKQMEATFNGYTLGYTYDDTSLDPVTLNADRAYNHLVLGEVGQGKTVYVRNFLIQLAAHGHGFCYLDRYDSQDHLLHVLPEDRLEDVILLDMEPEEKLDYEFLYEVIQDGKIILFQPDSYFRGEDLELDQIIRTVVDARSDLDEPDPFYLAWDHMHDVDEEVFPRSLIHDLVSRGRDTNIGTVFTANSPYAIHSRDASRKLLINGSDVHIGFKVNSSDMNEFALKYDIPVYQTEARQEVGSDIEDYDAIVNTPEFGPDLIHPFPQYPPKHTKQEIFSGPLLRYKI